MPEVISNTSCLIILDNLNLLWILKEMYRTISITEEVASEFGVRLDDWIAVKEVHDKKCLKTLQVLVDIGEASSMALAMETVRHLLILDDLKARNLAHRLDLRITGTLGVLVKARQRNVVSSLKEILEEMKRLDFRVSRALEDEMLRSAGEL